MQNNCMKKASELGMNPSGKLFLFKQLAAGVEGEKPCCHRGGDIDRGRGNVAFFHHGHGFCAEGGEGGEAAAKAGLQKNLHIGIHAAGLGLGGDKAHEKAADEIGEKGGKGQAVT